MNQDSIYCVGLSTSPRREGNTDTLLTKALEGAEKAGAKTEYLRLSDYRFSPCIGCNGCFRDGNCVINDDMQRIYPKLLEADRIILAAPIFSMGMCAQAKSMVDRTQRFWSTKYILKRNVIINKELRPARKGIYISASGSDHKNVFDGALQVARYFFLMLEADFTGSFCYSKIDEKGDVFKHPEILQEVFDAGYELCKS